MHLRVGPWFILMPFYVIALIITIIYIKPDSILENAEIVYPELYSNWWYYNAIVGCWMLGFLIMRLYSKFWIICSFTIQSWTYLTIRHCLTALSPFFPNKSHFLLKVNEILRFPALVTATVTFTVWNFVIAPAIYIFLETPKKRRGFLDFNFSFVLIQVHVFNIVFAVLNAVSVSPNRLFTFEDLWCSLVMVIAYCLFYWLILDRLGIHLYPIFSPRTKYTLISASAGIGVYYAGFVMWNKAIQNGTFEVGKA